MIDIHRHKHRLVVLSRTAIASPAAKEGSIDLLDKDGKVTLKGLQLAQFYVADERAVAHLEKLLSVLNGMLYQSETNRAFVAQDGRRFKAVLGVLDLFLPLEMLETILFILHNLSMDRKKALQEMAGELGVYNKLCSLVRSLHDLETEISPAEGSFLIVDLGRSGDKTIIRHAPGGELHVYESDGSQRTLSGREAAGKGIRVSEVCTFGRDMREFAY